MTLNTSYTCYDVLWDSTVFRSLKPHQKTCVLHHDILLCFFVKINAFCYNIDYQSKCG